MKANLTYILLFLLLQILTSTSYAQTNEPFWNSDLQRIAKTESRPDWVYFKEGSNLDPSTIFKQQKSAFQLRAADEMRLKRTDVDDYGFSHHRYQQYYKGIPVEYGEYIVHARNGRSEKANGSLGLNINLSPTPQLSEKQALEFALKYVNAKVYKWEVPAEEEFIKGVSGNPNATYYPQGELLIVNKKYYDQSKEDDYVLAYKFPIESQLPNDGRMVYVSAVDGSIVGKSSMYLFCNGNCQNGTDVQTLFNGVQTIENGDYKLHDLCRADSLNTRGADIRGLFYKLPTDNNTNWLLNDTLSKYASAHWAAEVTYDYFCEKHNRQSFDGQNGKMNQYISYLNRDKDNAHYYHNNYIDILYLGLPDDRAIFPLVSLDIVGHEWTHGVIQTTAGLRAGYSMTRALNESFADIFGTMIEFYGQELYDPNNPGDYQIGEDVLSVGDKFRDMGNPKSVGHPDTYNQNPWDITKPYNIAAIPNYWFYLLAEGGSGTNDNGYNYNISGIGKEDAARIAYRNLTTYLTNDSQFTDARIGSVEATIDLFGECSYELEQVTQAWNAVGFLGKFNFLHNTDIQTCGNSAPNSEIYYLSNTNIYLGDNHCYNPNKEAGVFDNSTFVAKAGESIVIDSKFCVELGSTFHAYIKECDGTYYLKSKPSSQTQLKSINVKIPPTASLTTSPNPFTHHTNITFELSQAQTVSLAVYDVTGKLVQQLVNQEGLEAGEYQFLFEGSGLLPGMYFCSLRTAEEEVTKKLMLMK